MTMEKKTRHIFAAGLLLMAAGACDMNPEMELSMTVEDATGTYLNTMGRAQAVYTFLPDGLAYMGDAMLASACDEAEFTNQGGSVQLFNTGAWSFLNNPDGAWSRCFNGIYAANLYLETSDNVDLDYLKYDPSSTAQEQYELYTANLERAKYEVRFLRAYFYFELIQRYGGVPVMERTYDVEDESWYTRIPRYPLDECIDFIVAECNEVAEYLPVRYEDTGNLGRATKGAALALKSRALLFAASDLFNDPSWAGGYNNPELISMTGGVTDAATRTEQWDMAARAAKEVIDLAQEAGYSMPGDYSQVFNQAHTSPETIFARRYGSGYSFEIANYSIGFDNGNSGNTPSQNLVDAFETAEGRDFSWDELDPGTDPYEDRDPRLAAFILTNNSEFKGRIMEIYPGGMDGEGIVNATRTGYYLKKYVNPDADLLQGRGTIHAWIIFRLAEMYLNYAEAMNEAYGPGDDHGYGLTALQAVNIVRSRTGVDMPSIPTSWTQEQLREKIRNERRVELCFEGHRMFDVRRWMIAEDVLNEPLAGVSVSRSGKNYLYERKQVESRTFSRKMYLYPIPRTDLQISGWPQNPLW